MQASSFPWTYEENEECYVTEGRKAVRAPVGSPSRLLAVDSDLDNVPIIPFHSIPFHLRAQARWL